MKQGILISFSDVLCSAQRITEQCRFERSSEGHPVQSPLKTGSPLNSDKIVLSSLQSSFEHLQEQRLHILPRQVFQCLNIFRAIFTHTFPPYQVRMSHFNLWPWSLLNHRHQKQKLIWKQLTLFTLLCTKGTLICVFCSMYCFLHAFSRCL